MIFSDADVVHAVVGGCLVEELGAVATQIGCDEAGYLSIATSVVDDCCGCGSSVLSAGAQLR
jgi:hypothetical protein